MGNRSLLIQELIRNPRADAQTIQELAAHGMDSDKPLATVSRADFITVLRQFENGALSAPELKAWASRLIGRRDIEFEFGHEGAVMDALSWLVYEEMGESSKHVCEHIESMLERRRRDRP